VTVEVERHDDARMAEQFLDHLGRQPAAPATVRLMRHKRDMATFSVTKTMPLHGLQIRARRFDSGRGHQPAKRRATAGKPVRSSRFAKRGWLCYRPGCRGNGLFPGSSVVEQPAVNRLVAGSNPARGANKIGVSEGPHGP
jgi:hypothetical protein